MQLMDNPESQLAALYGEHGSALLAYLGRSFGHVEAADDLLQETMLQVARWPRRLSEATSPRAWLYTVARRVGLAAARRRRFTTALPRDLPAVERPEDPRLEQVRGALAQLPDPQREAIELRLRDGLSYEEIAEVQSIPVGTVRSRLHHALRRLREALAGSPAPAPGEDQA